MIILDATTKSLQVVLAGAVTTSQLECVASYVDLVADGSTFLSGESDTVTNGATPVTLVAAPAASTQRQIKYLTVFNADTATATTTIRYNDNATIRRQVSVTLAVGSTLIYTDGEGWRVLTSAGAIISVGTTGAQGPQGVPGPFAFGADGDDGSDGVGFPGPVGAAGAAGATGATGPSGVSVIGQDGADGDDGMPIPGPAGPAGAAGAGTVTPFTTGRLTVVSGNAVPTTDQTAKGTIYYTSIANNGTLTSAQVYMSLYSGSALTSVNFSQLSLALTVTSGKNYDVFVDYNAGTPQLALSAAWTNDTTRTDALAIQSGFVVKSGSTTLRWVGTIRASGSNITEDSAANRLVSNAYNYVARSWFITDPTASWSYGTATWRAANANNANRVTGVFALGTLPIQLLLNNFAIVTAAASIGNAIGEDSTSAPHANCVGRDSGYATVTPTPIVSSTSLITLPASSGYHYYQWIEMAIDGASVTNLGTPTSGDTTRYLCGMSGFVWN